MNRNRTLINWLAAALAAMICTPAFATPGADVYGNTPDLEGIRLSHDARRIAYVQTRNGGHVVFIEELASGAQCGFAVAKLKVRELYWAPQGRLLIRVSPSSGERSRFVSIDTKCSDPRLVFKGDVTSESRPIAWAPDGKRLLWSRLAISERVRGVLKTRIDMNVFAVDPVTGAAEVVEKGSWKTVDWLVDAEGNIRVRIDETRDGVVSVFARSAAGGEWAEVFSARNDPANRGSGVPFVAMGPKPDTVYVLTRDGGDKLGAYEFDLPTKSLGRAVFRHADYDVDNYQLDDFTNQVIGVQYTDHIRKVDYIDPALAKVVAALRALLPGEQVNVQSMSRDRSSYILRADGPGNPTGTYFHANTTRGQVNRLGARYPAIDPADIAAVRPIPYVARDGLKIPAYLTLPPHTKAGKLPLVVMPHGGPEARDSASFNSWAQFLATRGYAVFQPQFRGSDGYGLSFRQAGRLQWGLKMQDDITDGVQKLIEDGVVDPARVCIFGWSYGGYAAMAGLAFTPDLYKCGISGAGVSDLVFMFGHLRRKEPDSWAEVNYWFEVIGDVFKDAERLKATSPINNVDKMKAPLLLLHAEDDTIVPWRQSEAMAIALKRAGKKSEFILLEGDDHWLSHADTETRVLREIERFLGLHLK
jgi:dipeptidyl aminopeptidase/acylaminoacyl peptidase